MEAFDVVGWAFALFSIVCCVVASVVVVLGGILVMRHMLRASRAIVAAEDEGRSRS